MFVRSRVDKPMVFRKNGKSWTLKPYTVILIDDPTVTAKELKGCYGSRIEIIGNEESYKGSQEGRQPIKHVLKYKQEPHKKYTVLESSKEVIKKALEKNKSEQVLDDILAEVNKELDSDNKKVDTTKDGKAREVKPAGTPNDIDLNNKHAEASKADTSDGGNNGETKMEEKPKRTRRASANKATTKSRVKRTRKQAK